MRSGCQVHTVRQLFTQTNKNTIININITIDEISNEDDKNLYLTKKIGEVR